MKQEKPFSEMTNLELQDVLESIRDERRARVVLRREHTKKLQNKKETTSKEKRILNLVDALKLLKEQTEREKEKEKEGSKEGSKEEGEG